MAKKRLVILDTNILIEIMRKNIAVIQACDQLGKEKLAISSIFSKTF
jgi:rRNA-processing protein FCF1